METREGSRDAQRPPTLKQIAEIAGVHVSTVSRVLRQTDPPPEGWSDAAQRIRKVAEELAYHPNPWAASLRTRRTLVVGAVMPRLDDGVIATMFQGVQHAAEEADYSVVISSPADEPDAMRRAVELIVSKHVDGLILSSVHTPGDTFLDSLKVGRTPIVLLSRHADSQLPSVTGEDHTGGLLAAQHLIDLGHRRFGVIAGPAHASTANDRVRGFLDGLARVGIELNDSSVVRSGFEVADGVEAAQRLLGGTPRPTAVFAVNDTAAIGAMGVARDLGIAIPGELSVVGFNDIPVAAQLPVPLTTVRSEAQNMGATAMRLLLRLIAGRTATSTRLPVELMIRGSTAPLQGDMRG